LCFRPRRSSCTSCKVTLCVCIVNIHSNIGDVQLFKGGNGKNSSTTVSLASSHYLISANALHLMVTMQFLSRVSTNAGKTRELCLSTHGCFSGTFTVLEIQVRTHR
jgi:hypothetical protein